MLGIDLNLSNLTIMKKITAAVSLVLLLLSYVSSFSQNGNSSGRENWFPNRGNVGVGTRNPSKDLEVIGDINATNTITGQSIESPAFKGGVLNLSGNGIINGNVGIGVAIPSEKLDILGNLRLSGNLFANGLTIQSINSGTGTFGTLTVNQNSLFNGFVGIGINPTEKLHVGGNARIESDLFANKFTTTFIQTNELNAGLSSFTENVSFSKNALVSGKIGIGLTPSESLDVAGNIKSNAGLMSSTLTTGASQMTSLNVSQNANFNGLVGIGVTTATEKLHIGGNLKVDNSIFSNALATSDLQTIKFSATGLSSFADNASFTKDLSVGGKLGIGVSNPTERLEISGNVKTTGALSASQGSFAQGLTAGNSSISGNLQVSGALTSQTLSLADVTATNNVSVGSALTVTGASQLNGGATIVGTTTAENLQVTGSLSAGNIAITKINTTGDASVGQNLSVAGTAQIGGDVTVSGQLTAQTLSLSSISTTGNVVTGNELTVTGASRLNGGAAIVGNSSVNGDLQVIGTLTASNISFTDINANGNTAIGQNLTVNGSGQMGGDLNVTGNLKAGIVEATEFRTTGGGSPFNFENAVISQTLVVGTDRTVPANYKMAVGGNIIATGIDIKIPQKWPDYVFTDGYKLMTIEEVQAFILKHGHLPNVLSAKEMETKQNYSVSEMDAKMMEKIEELTLYLIQLKEENKELKTRLDKLEKK
jgi:predicted acyltransferase (DUF342 family)